MKYSIVVISKNRRDLLEKCLGQLRAAKVPSQIVVVEAIDRSDPVSAEGIDYIKIGANEGGFSKQRNMAIERSRGEYIIFVDDDCEITPAWFDQLIRPIEQDPDILGVLGAVFPKDPNIVGFCEGVQGHPSGGFKLHAKSQGRPIPLTHVSTCNSIIKKSAIEESGWFDLKNIHGSEDTDLLIRIVKKFGRNKFRYQPDGLVYHQPRNALKKLIPWYMRRGKSDAELFLKHTTHFDYLLQTTILLKIVPVMILSIVFRNVWILIIAFVIWLGLQFYRSRFMWGYFKYYPFSRIKQLSTYLVYPFIKLVADLMFDFGRITRALRFHEK